MVLNDVGDHFEQIFLCLQSALYLSQCPAMSTNPYFHPKPNPNPRLNPICLMQTSWTLRRALVGTITTRKHFLTTSSLESVAEKS